MSAIVSRRSLLGWMAALPFAKIAPQLAPKVEAAATVAAEVVSQVFKGGAIRIVTAIKGFELTDEDATALLGYGWPHSPEYAKRFFEQYDIRWEDQDDR